MFVKHYRRFKLESLIFEIAQFAVKIVKFANHVNDILSWHIHRTYTEG